MAFLDVDTDRMARLIAAHPSVDPGTARVFRRVPTTRTWRYPSELNVRPVEAVGAQRAPDPIRAGDTPARPARMPIVVFQAIRPILSVMANEFRVRQVAPEHRAFIPPQGQAALGERVNIRRPAAEAYGSGYTLNPHDPYAIL